MGGDRQEGRFGDSVAGVYGHMQLVGDLWGIVGLRNKCDLSNDGCRKSISHLEIELETKNVGV